MTEVRSTVRRTLRRGVGVAVGLAALSSCAATGPGVAADVAGDPISVERVDEFATLLCAVGGLAPGEGGIPTREARRQALQLLIGNELAFDLVDEDEIPQAAVSQAVAQNQQVRSSLPADLVEPFDEFVADFSRAQVGIVQLGRESLTAAGESAVDDQAAFEEGQQLRLEYAETADIEVDPRFGEVEQGVLVPGSGSLSVPVSDLAVAGAAEETPPTYSGMLPATQTCES